MLPTRETLLCRYHYDPLDRLVDCTPSAQPPTRRFYLKDRLATEIQGAVQRSIIQHDDQLLAQQQRQSGAVETRLLATDQQCSVLNVLNVARPHPLAYTPYGHRPAENGLLSLLGFNGERPDPVTGCYLLGNGYRAFNPVLMRFNSPDSWSPFGEGGLNTYVYCVGDPVNRRDPTGHTPDWLKAILRSTGLMGNRIHASPNGISNIPGRVQNSMENFVRPYSQTKTPAWTTQGSLAFAGTEPRHPGAPRPAISQGLLTTSESGRPNAPPPVRIQRRAFAYTVEGGEFILQHRNNRPINPINSIVSASSGSSDPSPRYSAPSPPPKYEDDGLPSYQQSITNYRWLVDPSKSQSSIRRGSSAMD